MTFWSAWISEDEDDVDLFGDIGEDTAEENLMYGDFFLTGQEEEEEKEEKEGEEEEGEEEEGEEEEGEEEDGEAEEESEEESNGESRKDDGKGGKTAAKKKDLFDAMDEEDEEESDQVWSFSFVGLFISTLGIWQCHVYVHCSRTCCIWSVGYGKRDMNGATAVLRFICESKITLM